MRGDGFKPFSTIDTMPFDNPAFSATSTSFSPAAFRGSLKVSEPITTDYLAAMEFLKNRNGPRLGGPLYGVAGKQTRL